jgi:hypothetical protein
MPWYIGRKGEGMWSLTIGISIGKKCGITDKKLERIWMQDVKVKDRVN